MNDGYGAFGSMAVWKSIYWFPKSLENWKTLSRSETGFLMAARFIVNELKFFLILFN